MKLQIIIILIAALKIEGNPNNSPENSLQNSIDKAQLYPTFQEMFKTLKIEGNREISSENSLQNSMHKAELYSTLAGMFKTFSEILKIKYLEASLIKTKYPNTIYLSMATAYTFGNLAQIYIIGVVSGQITAKLQNNSNLNFSFLSSLGLALSCIIAGCINSVWATPLQNYRIASFQNGIFTAYKTVALKYSTALFIWNYSEETSGKFFHSINPKTHEIFASSLTASIITTSFSHRLEIKRIQTQSSKFFKTNLNFFARDITFKLISGFPAMIAKHEYKKRDINKIQ